MKCVTRSKPEQLDGAKRIQKGSWEMGLGWLASLRGPGM